MGDNGKQYAHGLLVLDNEPMGWPADWRERLHGELSNAMPNGENSRIGYHSASAIPRKVGTGAELHGKGEKRMLHELEKAIGHSFRDISLLENALAHSSYANERFHNSLRSNERLEFLGDSILGMMVADHLYRNFPDRPEGELTRMRADMVCEQSLALIANKIGLGGYLLLGHGEERFGGRNRNSILADAVESVIAACYLDGGYEAALKFVTAFVLSDVPVAKLHNVDYKTALQEKVQQKKNQTLSYHLVGEEGPDHDKRFRVEVLLNGNAIGSGTGTSKKRAEQDAARVALEGLTK